MRSYFVAVLTKPILFFLRDLSFFLLIHGRRSDACSSNKLRAIGNDEIEFRDKVGNFSKQEGYVLDTKDDSGQSAFRFVVRIPPNAKLGNLGLKISGKEAPDLTFRNAIVICHPLVVIIDIDGMRRDVFYDVVGDNPNMVEDETTLHIHRLLGGEQPGKMESEIRLQEFSHGVGLTEATTIFPPVTALGHASIFSGADPRDYRMSGNQWFDRTTKQRFGYMGYDLFHTLKGTKFGFYNDRMHETPGITTIYEDAGKQLDGLKSVVLRNFYYGKGEHAAKWLPFQIVHMGLYKPPSICTVVEGVTGREGAKVIEQYQLQDPEDTLGWNWPKEMLKLGIVTLYFPTLDHRGHDNNPPLTIKKKQEADLINVIDPATGVVLNAMNDVTYKNSTYVFVNDHGQIDIERDDAGNLRPGNAQVRCFATRRLDSLIAGTPASGVFDVPFSKMEELMYEFGYLPPGTYRYGAGVVMHHQCTVQVGFNAGMAHVYLRRVKNDSLIPKPRKINITDLMELNAFEDWASPPLFGQVLSIAQMFKTWNDSGWETSHMLFSDQEPKEYRGSIELILVRNAETKADAPYHVYRVGSTPMPFGDYLRTEDGKRFLQKYGWNVDARDADLLVDRLERMNGPMSGDIVLIPRYPEFYFQYVPLHGDHGGFFRGELEVPFIVARPGALRDDLAHLKSVLLRSIDMSSKRRPAVTDVKSFVLNILKEPAPYKEVEPPSKRAQKQIEVWDLKETRVADPKWWKFNKTKDVTSGGGIFQSTYHDKSTATVTATSAIIDYVREDTYPDLDPRELEFQTKTTWTTPPKTLTTDDIFTMVVDWQVTERFGKYRRHDLNLFFTTEARVFLDPHYHTETLHESHEEPTRLSSHRVYKFRIGNIEGLSQSYDTFKILIHNRSKASYYPGEGGGQWINFVEFVYVRRQKPPV